MTKLVHNNRLAGLQARLAPAFFLLGLVFLTPSVAAQTANRSRVSDSILGVRVGTSFDAARKKIEPFSIASDRATDLDEQKGERGIKRVWRLNGTDYTSVALKANKKGRVVWITGFVRPDKELLFSELGDAAVAMRATDSQAIWNIATPNGGYRLVAKGQNGRARVIYLLSLAPAAK